MAIIPAGGTNPFSWAEIALRQNEAGRAQAIQRGDQAIDTIARIEAPRQNAAAEPAFAMAEIAAKAKAIKDAGGRLDSQGRPVYAKPGGGSGNSAATTTAVAPDGELVEIPSHLFDSWPELVEQYEPVIGAVNKRGTQKYRKKVTDPAAPAQTSETPTTGEANNAAKALSSITQPTSAAPTTSNKPVEAKTVTSTPEKGDPTSNWSVVEKDGKMVLVDKTTGQVIARPD